MCVAWNSVALWAAGTSMVLIRETDLTMSRMSLLWKWDEPVANDVRGPMKQSPVASRRCSISGEPIPRPVRHLGDVTDDILSSPFC